MNTQGSACYLPRFIFLAALALPFSSYAQLIECTVRDVDEEHIVKGEKPLTGSFSCLPNPPVGHGGPSLPNNKVRDR